MLVVLLLLHRFLGNASTWIVFVTSIWINNFHFGHNITNFSNLSFGISTDELASLVRSSITKSVT